jgi:O-acetyl-ADP-ribose deacetylase (regulator of RNase III)
MPFKIVRNDITKMKTDAIVNTANAHPIAGPGCDRAVYEAAGYNELLSYRKTHIGPVKEGEVFLTPGFGLPAKYIIHAVSPLFIDGSNGEEKLLRSCYRKSLALAAEKGFRSVAFPLISTGSFGYPKEEGMRIAVDEIHAFLLSSNMLVYLVVFDDKATRMGRNLYPDLEAYIDHNYVQQKNQEEYDASWYADSYTGSVPEGNSTARKPKRHRSFESVFRKEKEAGAPGVFYNAYDKKAPEAYDEQVPLQAAPLDDEDSAIEEMERKLADRMKHMADTFPQYLLYLISEKGMGNAEVYKRAIVDKKVFSKIKNNPNYHPQKLTALCLCIGAKLNLDESKDLLARAGYALSPCDKTDIIFSYFIENEIYDMIELDIQLEEHGLPCIIT